MSRRKQIVFRQGRRKFKMVVDRSGIVTIHLTEHAHDYPHLVPVFGNGLISAPCLSGCRTESVLLAKNGTAALYRFISRANKQVAMLQGYENEPSILTDMVCAGGFTFKIHRSGLGMLVALEVQSSNICLSLSAQQVGQIEYQKLFRHAPFI